MRAAIYARISKDAAGEGAGVARQVEDCRALAAAKGFKVTAEFVDNDVSAFTGKRRPSYEALLETIRSGHVDVVIVWHSDRLYRRMADLETYITVCQDRDVPTHAVQAGHLDLATPSGRMVARTLGSVAQYESEQKAERQRRANLQRALEGRHISRTRRRFGYDADGVTVREDEAEAIRAAYQGLLDGVSLSAIARRWNAAGFTTPQAGNEWTGPVLRANLRLPSLAGIQTYRGEIMRDADGGPLMGRWPAVVDVDTWAAAQAVLADPDRRWPAQSRGLLSGVARCGVCGATMQSGGTRNGRRRYRCRGSAGHAYREAAPIDRYVREVILAYLSRPDIRDQLRDADAGAALAARVRHQLAEIRQRSDGLVAAFTDGTITVQQLRDGQARLAEKTAELECQLPRTGSPTMRAMLDASDPGALWDALDDEAQRTIIDALMTVFILPAGSKESAYLGDWRQRVLNPQTVVIEWRPVGEPEDPRRRRKVTQTVPDPGFEPLAALPVRRLVTPDDHATVVDRWVSGETILDIHLSTGINRKAIKRIIDEHPDAADRRAELAQATDDARRQTALAWSRAHLGEPLTAGAEATGSAVWALRRYLGPRVALHPDPPRHPGSGDEHARTIEALQLWAAGADRLSAANYGAAASANGWPSISTVTARFGSWHQALTAAEIEPTFEKVGGHQRWTQDQLVALVRAYFAAHDTWSMLGLATWLKTDPTRPSIALIRKRLGTWRCLVHLADQL